jgi:hypothetical protein
VDLSDFYYGQVGLQKNENKGSCFAHLLGYESMWTRRYWPYTCGRNPFMFARMFLEDRCVVEMASS